MSYPKKIRYEILGNTYWAIVHTSNEVWRLTHLVEEEGNFAKTLIKSLTNKKFFDIGGAVGGYSIPALSLCSEILVLEPDPFFSSHLEKNIPSQFLLKSCLSNTDGIINLETSGTNSLSPRLKGFPGKSVKMFPFLAFLILLLSLNILLLTLSK